MTQLSTKASSLVVTPIPSDAVNNKSEPVEVVSNQRHFSTTLSEVVAALGHVALPTAGNTTPEAGNVGELISSTVLAASKISLTTATPVSVTHIALTAGDWEITGNVTFTLSSATCTQAKASSGTVDATQGIDQYAVALAPNTTTASATLSNAIPTRHLQLAAPASVYLVAEAAFSAGTVSIHGSISARRAS